MELVNDLFEGFSHNDPMPQNSKDESAKEAAIGGGWETTKRRIACVDSPLTGGICSSTSGKRLRKSHNMDFLLGVPDVLITIPDDDALCLSEGMDTKAT